jgi:hypothetical protein
MGNLAATYADMGETMRARELEEQVLELRERISGEEHPDTILAMGNLAVTYADMGETMRARKLQEQVLELRKRISGEEHPLRKRAQSLTRVVRRASKEGTRNHSQPS